MFGLSERYAQAMTATLRLLKAGSPLSLDFDVLVVGSGFGGSVTALRLTEKGYRVGVLEAGAVRRRRLRGHVLGPEDVPLRAPRSAARHPAHRRAPGLHDLVRRGRGRWLIDYANTLYEPLSAFYDDPAMGDITDWRAELAPYYDQAKRMLGVVANPLHTLPTR